MFSVYLFIFVFGLIAGSFLNVVIFRQGTGRTLSGRSGCLSCGGNLRWYELLPVASFIIQRGRCRQCGSPISWQYPLVELLTGILFAVIYFVFQVSPLMVVFFWLVSCLLIIIAVYDFRHKIIPNSSVYLLILFGLARALATRDWSGLITGAVIGLLFFAIWRLSVGRWLGFGDVKLALGLGLLTGPMQGLSALVISVWLGAGIGLALIALGKTGLFSRFKSFTMKSELPFAPFLIAGFLASILFNWHVF